MAKNTISKVTFLSRHFFEQFPPKITFCASKSKQQKNSKVTHVSRHFFEQFPPKITSFASKSKQYENSGTEPIKIGRGRVLAWPSTARPRWAYPAPCTWLWCQGWLGCTPKGPGPPEWGRPLAGA
jgi:hypothetical protein